jgi:hypothetical protein
LGVNEKGALSESILDTILKFKVPGEGMGSNLIPRAGFPTEARSARLKFFSKHFK